MFALSVLLGAGSDEKRKYFYPLLTAILFMPSVFLLPIYHQNTDALIYAILYLADSAVGVLLGTVIRIITAKLTAKK